MLHEFLDSVRSLGLDDHFSLAATPVNSAVSLASSSSHLLHDGRPASPAPSTSPPQQRSATTRGPGGKRSSPSDKSGPPAKSPHLGSSSVSSLGPLETDPVEIHLPPAPIEEVAPDDVTVGQ